MEIVKPVETKTINQTDVFEKWLKQQHTDAFNHIMNGVDKLRAGIMSHTKSIGGGLFELKIHFAKGIRVYFMNENNQIILNFSGRG
jgi:putative addiction module killer protein